MAEALTYGLEIVTRTEWGAREPRYTDNEPSGKIRIPMDHVCFNSTFTESCDSRDQCDRTVRDLQAQEMDEDHIPDISFNFLIGGDGLIYEGRGWDREPCRALLYEDLSTRGVEIGYIGDYSENPPSSKMMQAGIRLILYGIKNHLIKQQFECIHLS